MYCVSLECQTLESDALSTATDVLLETAFSVVSRRVGSNVGDVPVLHYRWALSSMCVSGEGPEHVQRTRKAAQTDVVSVFLIDAHTGGSGKFVKRALPIHVVASLVTSDIFCLVRPVRDKNVTTELHNHPRQSDARRARSCC